jgi:ABC-type nitrate/sulfonate/bicarbonate transport system substrate-binding protein
MSEMRPLRKSFNLSVILCVSLVILSVFSPLACSKKQPEGKVQVRIGWLPLFYGLPHFVATDRGIYKKHGIQVESIKFQTSNDLADAIAAGRIDAAAPISMAVLLALEGRTPGKFKLFMVYATRSDRPTDYLLVRKDSTIASISELKGRRIGTFPGSTMRLYARLALKPDLELPGDAQLIELRPELQLPALVNKQVDALLTYDADAAIALASKEVRVLAKGIKARIMDPFPSGAFVFSSQFIRQDRKAADAVKDAISEAIQFIQSDQKIARKSAISFLPALETKILENMELPDYWMDTDINLKYIAKYEDILYEAGQLTKQIEVKGLIFE